MMPFSCKAMLMPLAAAAALIYFLAVGSCGVAAKEGAILTVSGQSAGASMCVNHLFAYSSMVKGAAIAAGSPYGCGSLILEGIACYYAMLPFQLKKLTAYALERSKSGLIDSLSNLSNVPVVLFNGRKDLVVWASEMKAVEKQLFHFGMNIKPVFNTSAGHVWSVDHGICPCGHCADGSQKIGPPRCCDVNNCGYDLSGDMFRSVYGASAVKPRKVPKNSLHFVPQKVYVPALRESGDLAGVAKYAMVYLPSSCEADPSKCDVHINYHGCIANDFNERRRWANNIDLNSYGEANGIVIVYPQANGTHASGFGCWNWGFQKDDKYFDTKISYQISMSHALAKDITAALKTAVVIPNDQPAPPWN